MSDTRRNLNHYAMLLGTYMGIYWILKFCLVPFAVTNFFAMMLFIGLTICVPFMGYYYTRLYRDKVLGGYINFVHAMLFTCSLYIFASLLTAMAHYIYFEFLDNGYIINTYTNSLNTLQAENIPGTEGYLQQIREALNLLSSMSAIDLAIQLLSNNIFYGILLSVVTALIVKKNAPVTLEKNN